MRKLLFLSGALVISTLCYTGCQTKPAVVITQSEGVIINSVDVGMNTWALYVKAHVSDGAVTQQQLDTVKSAYTTYYNAQLIAKAALETYIVNGSTNTVDITTANTAVSGAETALLSILNQYIK
jgi:(2Fe-2S) ferredoxin